MIRRDTWTATNSKVTSRIAEYSEGVNLRMNIGMDAPISRPHEMRVLRVCDAKDAVSNYDKTGITLLDRGTEGNAGNNLIPVCRQLAIRHVSSQWEHKCDRI